MPCGGPFRRHCLSPDHVRGRDYLGLFLRPVHSRRVRVRRVRGPVLWAASPLPRLRSPALLLLAVRVAGEVFRQHRLPFCCWYFTVFRVVAAVDSQLLAAAVAVALAGAVELKVLEISMVKFRFCWSEYFRCCCRSVLQQFLRGQVSASGLTNVC